MGLAAIASSLQCPDGIAAVLAAQEARGADTRRVGIALRWLRPLLPEKARGRSDGESRVHRRRVQAARSRALPLPSLRAPSRARSRLRRARPGRRADVRLAADDVRVSQARGRPGSRLVAPARLR